MGLLSDNAPRDLPGASDAMLIALNDGTAPEGRAVGEAVTGEESRDSSKETLGLSRQTRDVRGQPVRCSLTAVSVGARVGGTSETPAMCWTRGLRVFSLPLPSLLPRPWDLPERR